MGMPFYPKYVDAWVKDCGALSLEEEGAYCRLMDRMWQRAGETGDCSLPNDDAFIARLLGIPTARWKKLRAVLVDNAYHVYCHTDGDAIRQKRLGEEWAKATELSKTRRDAVNCRKDRQKPPTDEPQENNIDPTNVGTNVPSNDVTHSRDISHPTSGNGTSLPSETGSSMQKLVPVHTLPAFAGGECSGIAKSNGGAKYGTEFETFWRAYPRKTDKDEAFKAWTATAKARPPTADLIAAVGAAGASEQWRRGVIPHASTWLRKKRWLDEYEPEAQTASDAAVKFARMIGLEGFTGA